MLAYSPDQNIGDASVTDLSLAQSRSVAEATLQRLGLRESLASFIASYAAAATSDRILQFTVTAPSSDEAVIRANARGCGIPPVPGRPPGEPAAARVRCAATARWPAPRRGCRPPSRRIRPPLRSTRHRWSTAARYSTSAAPIKRSLKKTVTYPGGGLLAGLALGMGFVIIETLVSDRPRRRDDVARALGAPVRFSVGKVRLSRWLPASAPACGRSPRRRSGGSPNTSAAPCRPGPGGSPPWPWSRSAIRGSRRCPWYRWPRAVRSRA